MKQDFKGLREKLEHLSFPSIYMFKFIVKSDLKKIAQIESMFNSERAEITRKESTNGSFVSITVKEVMLGVDEIINIYKASSTIEGVIAL